MLRATEATGTQALVALHTWPVVQPGGHTPPQPLEPQVFPAQLGVHATTHWPEALQVPLEQVPQLPPQPSEPQTLPVHWGTQVVPHWPVAVLHVPVPQVPQVPPQPSGPQARPVQAGTHCPPSGSTPPSSAPTKSPATPRPQRITATPTRMAELIDADSAEVMVRITGGR
jgi:hypothetical protein